MPILKKCIKCNEVKDIDFFSIRKNINKTNVVYRKSECRQCAYRRTKLWKTKNKQKFLLYQKNYWNIHKSKKLSTV